MEMRTLDGRQFTRTKKQQEEGQQETTGTSSAGVAKE